MRDHLPEPWVCGQPGLPYPKWKGVTVTHEHLNDGTVAGIKLEGQPVFSVQFHPEASAGPHDSRHLFDRFITHITQQGTTQPV